MSSTQVTIAIATGLIVSPLVLLFLAKCIGYGLAEGKRISQLRNKPKPKKENYDRPRQRPPS